MVILTETTQKIPETTAAVENDSENNVQHARWIQHWSPQYLLLITLLAATILSSVTLSLILFTRYSSGTTVDINKINSANNLTNSDVDYHGKDEEHKFDYSYSKQMQASTSHPIDSIPPSSELGQLKIVSRPQWLAQPPVEPATPLVLPVPFVIIHHTATEDCSNIATCTFHIRFIQNFHIDSRGWWDISYNFLVGGDGNAYEGRGWESQGAHTYGYNAKSIGIAFVGTFNDYLPPEAQIRAAKQLIEIGVEKGYIAKDYKLLAASQLQPTQSPGLKLYEEIKSWSHWSEKL